MRTGSPGGHRTVFAWFSVYPGRPEKEVLEVNLGEYWTSYCCPCISCLASERARKHGFGIGCFLTFMPRRRGEEEQEKKTRKFFDQPLVLALAETRHGADA